MAAAIGLIVLAAGGGFACGRMLGANPAVRFQRRPVTMVAVAILMVIGMGMTWREISLIQVAAERREWPKVQGEVTLSEVRGTRAYHPYVTYTFTVEGESYDGNSTLQAPGFGPKSSRREVARKSLADYAVGDALIVYYDPADPSDSCLKTGAPWDAFMRMSLGLVFLFSAGGVAAMLRHRSGVPENVKASSNQELEEMPK